MSQMRQERTASRSRSTYPSLPQSRNTAKARRISSPDNPIWVADSSKEWNEHLHKGTVLHFKAKERIPNTHNGERGFYYLKHGKARVAYAGPQGNEITLYHIGEGGIFYEAAATGTDMSCVVYAITPLEVYFFKTAEVFEKQFMHDNPKLILSLMQAQSVKSKHHLRRLLNIAGGNAFSNACRLMLDLSRSHGNAHEVPLGVTHEEIASILCVRRSWLGKILRRLKDEGVISRCTKARLVIEDMAKLQTYAVGNE